MLEILEEIVTFLAYESSLPKVGKLNQYDQGIYLRDRYDKFLGKIYSPEIFWLQSTGADRTKMSALLEAAGLWKPNDAQTFKDDLPWQPAVLHYQSLDFDTLLLARLPCPAYSMELERVKNSSEYRKILIDNKELLQQLSNLTGWDMQSPDDMLSLYGTLRAESDLNLTLPSWTKEYYPEKLLPLSTYSFTLNVYNDLLRRLKGGPLLKKILSDMVDKSRDTLKPKNRKMFMYAGHDSTVANLLGTMGVWDKQMPEYNIMAIVELHREKDNWNVQMFLRNTTEHEPYSLTVPGCSTICPLDRFIEITKPVIPINWSEECKVDDPNYVPPPPPMV
ncbi:prostatic acid phosphatase-like isoform X2 [Orussus abietinus]|uniref:prostatic acid phosphatase-like isoform X2 n=1 Tax=Orussus abietinus TaxID=222816 RepID=UPI000625BC47|nr:prostatic acid phosphatase-like isoform X2 [Orussus abietinus]